MARATPPPPPRTLITPSLDDEGNSPNYTLDQTVLHIQSPTLKTTYICCPPERTIGTMSRSGRTHLGLKHPWIHMLRRAKPCGGYSALVQQVVLCPRPSKAGRVPFPCPACSGSRQTRSGRQDSGIGTTLVFRTASSKASRHSSLFQSISLPASARQSPTT